MVQDLVYARRDLNLKGRSSSPSGSNVRIIELHGFGWTAVFEADRPGALTKITVGYMSPPYSPVWVSAAAVYDPVTDVWTCTSQNQLVQGAAAMGRALRRVMRRYLSPGVPGVELDGLGGEQGGPGDLGDRVDFVL